MSSILYPSRHLLTCSVFLRAVPIPLCKRKTINFCVADTWTILALMLRSLKQINGLPLHQLHQPSESKLFILLTPTEILCEKGSEISKKTQDCSGGEQLKLRAKKNPVKVSGLLLPEETRDCYFIFAKTHKKKTVLLLQNSANKERTPFFNPQANSVEEFGGGRRDCLTAAHKKKLIQQKFGSGLYEKSCH